MAPVELLPPFVISPTITTRVSKPHSGVSVLKSPGRSLRLHVLSRSSKTLRTVFTVTLTRWCCWRPQTVLSVIPKRGIPRILCYPPTSMSWLLWRCKATFFILYIFPFMSLAKTMRGRPVLLVIFVFSVRSWIWSGWYMIPLSKLQMQIRHQIEFHFSRV